MMKPDRKLVDKSTHHWHSLIDKPKWRSLRGETYASAFDMHELAFIAGWNAAMRGESQTPPHPARGESRQEGQGQ